MGVESRPLISRMKLILLSAWLGLTTITLEVRALPSEKQGCGNCDFPFIHNGRESDRCTPCTGRRPPAPPRLAPAWWSALTPPVRDWRGTLHQSLFILSIKLEVATAGTQTWLTLTRGSWAERWPRWQNIPGR